MNNLELSSMARRDPVLNKIFSGVFSSDTLPERIPFKPLALIVNTDESHEKGEHWVAMYFDEEGSVDYFDSYAIHPSLLAQSFTRFMERNSSKQNFNDKRLQSLDTAVCGMYCIYFLHERSRRKRLKTITKHFGSNFERNDVTVCNFVRRLYGVAHKVCCSNVKMQKCVPYCKFRNAPINIS